MPLDSASAPSCVTSAKIAGRSPSVSELVFCLDEIQCLGSVDDSQTTMHGSEFDAVVLASLALEHAKHNDIWYGIADVQTSSEEEVLKTYLRMTPLGSDSRTRSFLMACDLKRSSYRYAFLRYLDDKRQSPSASSTVDVHRERLLISLPEIGEGPAQVEGKDTTSTFPASNSSTAGLNLKLAPAMPDAFEVEIPQEGVSNAAPLKAGTILNTNFRNSSSPKQTETYFTSADEEMRSKTISVRVTFNDKNQGSVEINGSNVSSKDILQSASETRTWSSIPSWRVLKIFSLSSRDSNAPLEKRGITGSDGTILSDLLSKQEELKQLEGGMETKLRNLLTKAFDERMYYESSERLETKTKQDTSIQVYEAIIKRRREADAAWRAQLEQDMDAVCDICLDGEVTVDNQILFCEACNVAVHQKCYGIPRIPEGDYFCKPCRYFGRDKVASQRRATEEFKPPKTVPSPLPISCEMCSWKQGAFVRTASKEEMEAGEEIKDSKKQARWIHVVCAKWMGLDYHDNEKMGVVECVHELKKSFRENYLQCHLCESRRGGFSKCHEPGCERWLHVTCARASGVCRVIHGENSLGYIEGDMAWKLSCPEHSNVQPEDIPKGSVSRERLIEAAKAFPAEPSLPPPVQSFDKLTGTDRAVLFSNQKSENDLVSTLLRRVEGARCAVCNVIDKNPVFNSSGRALNSLVTCSSCGIFVHKGCYLNSRDKPFICQGCKYVGEEKGKDEFEQPECHMCNMPGGALRKAKAIPVNKKRWTSKKKEFKRSLFGKQIWCHPLCAM